MGEISDLMLDGTICDGCGVTMYGDSYGVPRRCSHCRKHNPGSTDPCKLLRATAPATLYCPLCRRGLKGTAGLTHHARDAHKLNLDDIVHLIRNS